MNSIQEANIQRILEQFEKRKEQNLQEAESCEYRKLPVNVDERINYLLNYVSELDIDLKETMVDIWDGFIELEFCFDGDIIFNIRVYCDYKPEDVDMCTFVIHCLKSKDKKGNDIISSGAVNMGQTLFPFINDIITKAKEKQWTITEETISRDSIRI